MENNTFVYQHSSSTNKEVEKIRKKYTPAEESKMEKLKKLDGRAQSAGMIEALTVGIVGCLIFGLGMCFGLDALKGAEWMTVLFCLIGIVIMIPAYPVYKYISNKTKAELTPEILRLSEEIIKNN